MNPLPLRRRRIAIAEGLPFWYVRDDVRMRKTINDKGYETLMTVPVTRDDENYTFPFPLPQGEGVRGRVKGIFR